nr:hypothetical protein [uncultured Noviherbaspirillum sp.]
MFLLRSKILHCSFLLLCAALFVLGIGSHSQGPAFATAGISKDEGNGIYLYRRGALAAYAQPFRVSVDGHLAGFIANASYLRLPLAPGEHQIQIAPGGLAQVTTLQVRADAGSRTFYEFVFPTGWDMRPSFQGATIEARNARQALEVLPGLRRMAAKTGRQDAPNRHNIDD